ncbi:hypothetical protein MYCTH_2313181 [Thermothelomyces thermophilus ATCC 42464]|uniref:N-acetyltransferase domain-containing protein n=1 Tax=Thermothelomyces thermophilus (strain ATCC 42464 / BCRC 31852 / DSM 1799) TaxID=573729 RepID=G2QNW8_THET4|nr:uncharacterized protein MYCTH_2313181 [Thermothelomyces thermophilus ATCC 42464]AEO62144.1 hypothetical protein MYCTH_2313181 [Thermothelomyces thermophilus ATCC 42464]
MEREQLPIIIRGVRDEDIPAITEIYHDVVTNSTATYEVDPPTVSVMRDRLSALREAGFPCLVAASSSSSSSPDTGSRGILGYAYASAFRPRPGYRFTVENSVYVAPDARARGVGRHLMQALVKECERLGFRQMVAVIGDGGPSNPSVLFHEKLGFTVSGVLKSSGYKFGRWLDTVFMQLAIGDGAESPPDPASLPEQRRKN